MKRLIILLFAIVLYACAQPAPEAGPVPPFTTIGTEFVIDPVEETSSSTKKITKLVDERVLQTTFNDILSPENAQALVDMGIDFALEKVHKTDNRHLTLTIRLENKEGYSTTLEIPCYINYGWNGADKLNAYRLLGCDIAPNGDEIIVLNQDKVLFYSAHTLKRLDKTLAVPPAKELYDEPLTGVLTKENFYAITRNTSSGVPCLYIYDGDGNLLCDSAHYTDMYSEGRWLGDKKRYILCTNNQIYANNGYIFDTQELVLHRIGNMEMWEQGDCKVYLYGCDIIFKSYQKYIAVYEVGGEEKAVFSFRQENLPQLYWLGENHLKPEFSQDMSVVKFHLEKEKIDVTIDFNSQRATFDHYGTPDNSEFYKRYKNYELFVVFADWHSPYDKRVYIYDYNTDKSTFLAEFKRPYGEQYQNIEIGVNAVGDAYILRNDFYATYDFTSSRKTFDITQNFITDYTPLTNLSRQIWDMRRDQTDGTFLVFYSEDRHITPDKADADGRKFKIGYLDMWGNLLREYPLPEEYVNVGGVISLEGDHTVYIKTNLGMYGPVTEGYLDLQTGVYTNTVDNQEYLRNAFAAMNRENSEN